MKLYTAIIILSLMSNLCLAKSRENLSNEILTHFKNKAANVDEIAEQMSIQTEDKKKKFKVLADKFKQDYLKGVKASLKKRSNADLLLIVETINNPILAKFSSTDHSEKMAKYMAGEVSKEVENKKFKEVKKLYQYTYFKEIIKRTVGIQTKLISNHLPKNMVQQFSDKFNKSLNSDGEYMMYGLVSEFNIKEIKTLNALFNKKSFNSFYKETTFDYMDQYEAFLQKVFILIAP